MYVGNQNKVIVIDIVGHLLKWPLPLTNSHPSYAATFSIPLGWPHKRGTTVYIYEYIYVYSTIKQKIKTSGSHPICMYI